MNTKYKLNRSLANITIEYFIEVKWTNKMVLFLYDEQFVLNDFHIIMVGSLIRIYSKIDACCIGVIEENLYF